MTKKKILIATGGTGGHIFPALSLAKNLTKKNYNVQLTIDKRGLNYLEEYKNLNLIKITSSPFIKTNIFKFFWSITKIFFSIIKSVILLLFKRPSLIFGMGGYASFPICIAAAILKIKFIIYENNLIIGKANKYLLPFAEKIFVSFNDLEGISDQNQKKKIEVGNIVREEIINSSIKNITFDEIKILVLGGSQAAKIFAESLPQVFKKVKESGMTVKIFQQCQPGQNEKLSKFYRKENIDYEIFNFTHRIIDYYSKVNLVITRSGASALGEILNFRLPFIAIPLPNSAENHQLKNAIFFEKKGYGYLLEEVNISKQLCNLIISIATDKNKIQRIISNQSQYSDKEIFKKININIEKIIDEKN